MPEKGTLIGRDTQATQMLRQHVIQGECAIAIPLIHAICALPEHDAFQVLQYARLPQLREHTVNAIFRLIHIFEEQDRTVETGQIGCADKRGQHRQVSAEQLALRLTLARAQHARAPAALRHPVLVANRVRKQRRASVKGNLAIKVPRRLTPCAARVWAMQGHKSALGRNRHMQGRDVAEAGQ